MQTRSSFGCFSSSIWAQRGLGDRQPTSGGHVSRINVDFWVWRLGDPRASVNVWQQSSAGVFWGKHHHIILIKSTTIADFTGNHTFCVIFEAKPSDLSRNTSVNVKIGVYPRTYLWLQEGRWVQRQKTPSLDCWPTSSRTGRPRKPGCRDGQTLGKHHLPFDNH